MSPAIRSHVGIFLGFKSEAGGTGQPSIRKTRIEHLAGLSAWKTSHQWANFFP
jgi:hypothetical protein